MLRWDGGRGRQSDRQAENEHRELGGTRALRKEKDGNIIQRELGTCGWEAVCYGSGVLMETVGSHGGGSCGLCSLSTL